MFPKIGQTLIVRYGDGEGQEIPDFLTIPETYKSRLADIDDRSLALEKPMGEVEEMRLSAGDIVTIQYTTDGGVQNLLTTKVTGFRNEGVPLVVVKKPDPKAITRIQRRNYVRVPTELEVAVKTADESFTTVTEDLSGGGIAFRYEGAFELMPGMILSCWILIPVRKGENETVPFAATVVRTSEREGGGRIVMAEFSDIQDADRQKNYPLLPRPSARTAQKNEDVADRREKVPGA